MALLTLEKIHAGYGKKEVLRGLSVSVAPGQIVALFGGNGAGKSTVLKVASGVLRPWGGRVLFKGQDITGWLPHEIKRLGLSYLPQGGRVFKSLTVAENLAVAGDFQSRLDRREPYFGALGELWNKRAGLLSGGERQMLAMEMALCARSEILLLDEPTAALSEALAERLLCRLAEIVREGGQTSVLLVEQNVDLARHVADIECSLAGGTVLETTTPANG